MSGTRPALLRQHHGVADMDRRERLLAHVRRLAPREDVLLLATCHRVELYAAVSTSDPTRFLEDLVGAGFVGESEVLVDGEVVRHLCRLGCGLDSVVRGEAQILGQIRRTFDAERSARRLHPLLAALFQDALRIARDVRAATGLGASRRSVGSLAADEALRHLSNPERSTALVVGAGAMGKSIARGLVGRVGRMIIANRDHERARALAGDLGAEALDLAHIEGALAAADVVLAAADTHGIVLTESRLRARVRRGPLVIVDIAMPRSVPPEARSLAGLTYVNVDDLATPPDPALDEAVAEAERRCAERAMAFMARWRERDASNTIRALRGRAERMRAKRLERALARLGHLDERDRRVVEALASGITNALLHEPTVALRREPERSAEVAELFGLERS